jgi:SAM-dependent methyltransferase
MTVEQITERALASLRRHRLDEVVKRYDQPATRGPDPTKYLDAERWIAVCAQRAFDLGLDLCAGMRVLDLGTGAGYFPLVCQALGHACTATDWSRRDPLYREVTAAIGIEVRDLDVAPHRPLAIDPGFDLIAAFMVTFNGHRIAPWGIAEWRFFVDDCMRLLVDGGRLVLELNREADGRCIPRDVEPLWRSLAAEISGRHGHRIVVRKR